MPHPWHTPIAPTRMLGWSDRLEPPAVNEAEQVLRGLGVSIASVETIEVDPSSSLGWGRVVRTATGPAILVWAEPSSAPLREGEPPELARARWMVGVETLIVPVEGEALIASLATGLAAMRSFLCGMACRLAWLDVATGRWWEAAEIASKDAEGLGSEQDLWSVRVHRRHGATHAWIATEGLARCGSAELEMVEVPEALVPAAAALVDAAAPLLLEAGPERGDRWELGPAAIVVLEKFEDVIGSLSADSAGSMLERNRLGHEGPRAVICDPARAAADRHRPAPPLDLLRRIEEGRVAVHRSGHDASNVRRVVHGQGRVLEYFARRIEHHLQAHGGLSDGPGLLVSVAQAEGGVAWMEVVGRTELGLLGRSVDSSGLGLASAPAEPLPVESVVDWRLRIGGRTFGPREAQQAIDLLIESEQGLVS